MKNRKFSMGSHHVRAAAFMIFAVLCFTTSDAITKHISLSTDIIPTLFMRVVVAFFTVLLLSILLKQKITRKQLSDTLLLYRAIIFVITILLFAYAFKNNTFTGFYTVFFVFLPVFCFSLDFYLYKSTPDKKAALTIFIMLLFALLPNWGHFSETLTLASTLSIATALFYALYLQLSTYISQQRKYPPLPQILPNFLVAILFLGGMNIVNSKYRLEFVSTIQSFDNFVFIVLAGIISVFGVIFITNAASLDSPSRLAPYEYVVVFFALFIDNFLFQEPVLFIDIVAAIGVTLCAVGLATLNERQNNGV